MYKLLAFVLLVCAINSSFFLFLSDITPFMLTKNIINLPWSLITFQFCHLSQMHLVENIIGFVLVGFIATELNLNLKEFSFAYFAAVFVVIPLIFLLPYNDPIAGNSSGIYGVLSLVLLKSRKLIPLKLILPLFTLFMFSSSILDFVGYDPCNERCFQGEFYHFMGFVSGAVVSSIPTRKPKCMLREL